MFVWKFRHNTQIKPSEKEAFIMLSLYGSTSVLFALVSHLPLATLSRSIALYNRVTTGV